MAWPVRWGTRFGVPDVMSTVAFLNTGTGVGVNKFHGPNNGVFQRVDLKPLGVPADAYGVMLQGLCIISKGPSTGTTFIGVEAKRPDMPATSFQGEGCETAQWNGDRSGFALVVPCLNGEIDVACTIIDGHGTKIRLKSGDMNDPANWPTVGFTMNLVGVVAP